MKVRALIATLIATAAFFCCFVRSASAAPALWVVQSPSGGKVYLFGTVHLLRDSTQWRSPELEAAINESQDLYLEIADPGNVVAGASSLLKTGVDREHPLSTKISKADVALLDAFAKRYDFGGEAAFEPMRPWLVVLMISALPALHSGYSTSNGVDLQVRKEFVAAGKPIHGFETFDMQAHIFSDMPESTQIELLDSELKDFSKQSSAGDSTARLDRLVDAWVSGDEARLATELNVDQMAETPILARLLTDRNKAWANALAERLKEPGTSFVCVGAAHLAGTDGVPALLSQMGYKVTRVPIAEVATAAPSPSPVPAATAPATPIPQTLTPPAGWKPRDLTVNVGPLKMDRMWVDPEHHGAVISAHLEMPGTNALDLETLDALLHQGMAGAVGAKGVQPSTRVKICGGKQDGTLTRVTLPAATEVIVLAVSDRGYIAEYVRGKDIAEDPAATQSLLTLCAP